MLGEGYEGVGRHELAQRVVPPDERFRADDTFVDRRNDRLVVEDEAFPRQVRAASVVDADRPAQVRLDREAVRGVIAAARVVPPEAVAAEVLRVVQRRAGVADHAVRIEAVVRSDRESDAHGREDLAGVDDDRARELVDDRSREVGRRHAVRVCLGQDDELIAAESGEQRVLPDAVPNTLGDRLEEEIADIVAEGFVDGLEPVQVDEEHAERLAETLGAIERVREPLGKDESIREAGQRIEADLVRKQLRDPLTVRHVVGDAEKARHETLGFIELRFETRAVKAPAKREVAFRRSPSTARRQARTNGWSDRRRPGNPRPSGRRARSLRRRRREIASRERSGSASRYRRSRRTPARAKRADRARRITRRTLGRPDDRIGVDAW